MRNNSISCRQLLFLFSGVLVLWIVTPIVTSMFLTDWQTRGQFGDVYGSINALFSGLAFAGVIVAILLQRQELILQRQELSLTRQELTKSASAQEEAQKALNKSIYAQSFKVAVEMIDAADVIEARRRIFTTSCNRPLTEWQKEDTDAAEKVLRTFESVGTMIRLGTLPADYIIGTWSVPIARIWDCTKEFVAQRRDIRGDPFIAGDCEYLAGLATAFLREKNVSWTKY